LQARREWTPTYGRSFSGSTVGVVGLGAIGRAVAEPAHAMGARVIGVRRNAQLGGFAFVEAIIDPRGVVAASDAMANVWLTEAEGPSQRATEAIFTRLGPKTP
jgi:phosphoglycerate dehydrogenase-like enzyme